MAKQGKRPLVLLVDDEKVSLKILSDLLKDEVDIALAKNGHQALTKIAQVKPDLILMDVLMPGIDGFEVTKKLRADKTTESIPVIFITGLNSAGQEERGLTLGAQDYIHKPFNPEVVKARVATQLKIVRQRQQLQQLSNELTEASAAKSRFLANMSHEIRTPLTSIIGYADGITQGDFDQQFQRKAVEIIAQNGHHLLSVVNEILDLSKIEANKLEIELIEMDLMVMLGSIESLVEQQARSKGLAFNIDYQFPLPSTIKSDPTRLKQVLLNLINNAIKFTEAGRVNITVRCADDQQLTFDISDTGIGLSQSQMDKLFVDFTQVDSSVARKYGGTGLGLSIAQSLSHKLGGEITVKSQPQQGSTFTLSTCLDPCEGTTWIENTEQLTLIKERKKAPKQHIIPTLDGKVLLAEDHDDNRALFSQLLKRMGLTVTAVENGEQAVEASMKDDFDLIFLDIQMPVMDGITAMQMISTTAPNIPVIALTANAMNTEIANYLSQGFSAHIAKPIDRRLFINLVERYLTGKDSSMNLDIDLDGPEMESFKQAFLANLRHDLIEIKIHAQHHDWPNLGRQAHAIKGAAPMYGYKELGSLADKLEIAVHSNNQEQIQLLTQSLISKIHKIIH